MDRIVWHVGLPKTGTTYLQKIIWDNRDVLARHGVVVPGAGHREHLWAALDMREQDVARRDPRAPGAWSRLCEELAAHEGGTGLLTHEFFCLATPDQIRDAVDRLAPARPTVVVTARDAAAMLAAGWQEMVKNGARMGLRKAAREGRTGEFSWVAWDLAGVLERWSAVLPPEDIHVVPLPRAAGDPAALWHRFAGAAGLPVDLAAASEAANTSLGVVQIELLRQVNRELSGFGSAFDRGQWIRGYLAEGRLARQAGEKLALDADLLEDCRARSERAVQLIVERGFPVAGDPDELLLPVEPSGTRPVGSVSPEEVNTAAARLVADMLSDVRRLTDEARPAEDDPGPMGRLGRVWRRR